MKYPINPAKFIQGLSMRQKGVAFLLSIACAANIVAAPISSDEAAGRARAWMQGHPIMGVAAASGVQAITAFPDDTPPDCVYVVELLQGGYLVLTSDDRLEPVIAYSAASTVNLEDRPDNAFRALLLHYVAGLPETLDALPDVPWQAPLFAPLAGQQYGPYTETKWNQDYPYNLYCPTFSNPPNDSRRGRVPVGCVPTAWAQVMKYHSWPPYGQGGHTHASGSYPPVDFTTPFNWDNMQDVYSYLITTSQPGDVDVAALMYKLGIAADITYAASGSSADMNLLGVRIRDSMFYDAFSYVIAGAVTVSPFLKSDIQAGFPGILGIPGHAVVADGLSADEAFYHINYGWGGANDNWYALSALNVNCGLTQIRPSLMAFPCDKTVAATENSPVTLHWELPQWRANEADKINVKQLVSHTTTWTHNAENFSEATQFDWSLHNTGRTGKAWYSNEYSASLVLDNEFVPSATSALSFWATFSVHARPFKVQVSADGGQSWDTIYTVANVNNPTAWQNVSLSLSAYAGQTLRIKFTNGSVYDGNGHYTGTTAGVRLDDISFSNGTWRRWENYATGISLAANQVFQNTPITAPAATGTYRFAATLTAKGSGIEHAIAPEFTMIVTQAAQPTGTVRIKDFKPVGGGEFLLTWELDPAGWASTVEVKGSMVLPAANGWDREALVATPTSSATFTPTTNRFFRVWAQ